MDATQMISDSFLDSDEETNEEETHNKRGPPLAKLCILKNAHIPETELPLYLGDNVLGRDPNACTVPLPATSVSKQHATICISVYRRKGRRAEGDTEALVWDLGSMNGTRKGRLKLTPNVRYAICEQDTLVVADIPCQFVSCRADTVSSEGDTRTPVSRGPGVKAGLPGALGQNGGGASTDGKKCVNGGTRATGTLHDPEDTRGTPVRTGGLFLEQTPTLPQGTLVPESDSDSDGEGGGGGDRRRKAIVSDSDSYKSSPTCSTFLSPANKIVPESEDESPITPSLSAEKRPQRHVSFSTGETAADAGRQQPEEEKALGGVADDSEGEEEDERAALVGRKSEGRGQHLQESNDSFTGKGELPLPLTPPVVVTSAVPEFNMDSDTDVEGEDEGTASAGPSTLSPDRPADHPPNSAQFHMDSDTDVDEEDEASVKVPKPMPSTTENTKPKCAIPVNQPQGITMDSDTDVEEGDDDENECDTVSDTAAKAKTVPSQGTHTADSAPPTQLKDFHLDSDTDAEEEEEEEKECAKHSNRPEINQTPTTLVTKPESVTSAPHSPHLDSHTDDGATSDPALGEPSAGTAPVPESHITAAGKGADLGILSDSDTDVEEDAAMVIPLKVKALSVSPSDSSDADTDVDEPGPVPAAGDAAQADDPKADSDTDVEDVEEVDLGAAGDKVNPSLHRENTPQFLAPHLLNCSTPVQVSEGEVEEMETQAFLMPGPLSRKVAPVGPLSDSQEDEDFVVAETQSFILPTGDCEGNTSVDHTTEPTQAFDLEICAGDEGEQSGRGEFFLHPGSSDNSSRPRGQARAPVTGSTQSSTASTEQEGEIMEETQAYAESLEATQAYAEADEPDKDRVDLAMEATQAYIPDPISDSEDETDEEDEGENIAAADTDTQPSDLPVSSTLAMAETQLMCAFEIEESFENEGEGHGEAAKEEGHPSKALSVAQTQPMCASDYGDSDEEEDPVVSPQNRTATAPRPDEERPQPFTSPSLSLAETQPVSMDMDEPSGDEECDEKQSKQPFSTLQEGSGVETQPMATEDPEEEESDDEEEEDSTPGPRKRKAKRLHLEEEETQTQTLTNSDLSSALATQPMDTGGQSGGSNEEEEEEEEEDSFPGPRKRRGKSLRLQEESQPLTGSEEAAQPTPETKATKVDPRPTRATRRGQAEADTSGSNATSSKRGTRARLKEEEERQEPPRRQTRGTNKAAPTAGGRRGKPGPKEDRSEGEGAESVRAKGTGRDRKSTRQKKPKEEMLVTEREQERSRMERERAETERLESERKEQERVEREEKEKEEKEERVRNELEEKEREAKRELEERLEREREEKERQAREAKEREERERLEKEEKERKDQEEKERLETAKRELEERLEREREEEERQARLEREAKEQQERLEKEEKKRKDEEEKERLETAKREEKERQARQAREAEEREEQLQKEKQAREEAEIKERQEEEEELQAAGRSRRATRRRTTAVPQEPTVSAKNDDVPARRTRSRSNSSNSVCSERSEASGAAVATTATPSRARGRGGRGGARGAKRAGDSPRAAAAAAVVARGGGNRRRRTLATEAATEQVAGEDIISSRGVRSRSNSVSSLHSDISGCSVSSSSQGRGRGGARGGGGGGERGGRGGGGQRGRGRKTEPKPESVPLSIGSQSEPNSAPGPTARDRRRRIAEEGSVNEAPHEDDTEKTDSRQDTTTRGRRRAAVNLPEPAAVSEEKASNPALSTSDEPNEKRKGRKRELETNTEESPSTSNTSENPKGLEKEEEEVPAQGKRKGRASSAQAKKKERPAEVEVTEGSEETEQETAVGGRGKGRASAVHKKKKEEQDDSGTSSLQDSITEEPQPQTPTSGGRSRKRQAPADSSPVAKTPRSSSASPAAGGRLRAASQAYKVLFTGVVDEAGERVLARLGGGLAKGVADMNCLVTDKVRRTVKFLCALAKGVPIVTTSWLEKSGKAGSLLSPSAFLVTDPEQETKFDFCLQGSLRMASSQPLLQGYAIHVTKSVKPEPVHMKDIITCSGATFLAKMPSSHKPQTVVISCVEDWPLCRPALSASLPVVTAEFILTGILQQRLDLQTHALPAPAAGNNPQPPAGGRGRARK